MSEASMEIDHDSWAYSPPKLRSAGKITLPDIPNVLAFDGVRNPITASNTSHKISLTYKTEANKQRSKVGLVESGAELAVAEEALIGTDIYDVEFQPVRFSYEYPPGKMRWHTIDLRLTFKSGCKRFVFVRNRASLEKPWVQGEIDAIVRDVPPHEAHEFIVVEADSYSRPYRENLRRMHRLVAFQPDPISDQLVENAVYRLKSLWRMSDLHACVDLPSSRIFQSCLRLIAIGRLGADLDSTICHHSRVWRVEP